MNVHGAATWVEVSTDALRANFAAVAGYAGVPVCAVVKANAYGYGLVECARVFSGEGARMLAVTRWEEARAIRAAGIDSPVLILTPLPHEVLADAIAMDLDLCLSGSDLEPLEAAARKAGRVARVHLKIDTGMGRLGVSARAAFAVAEAVHANEHLALEGIWTHFAAAGTDAGRVQAERFETVRKALGKHAARAIVHAANSAATIAHPGSRYDMVRVGTLLYGLDPPNVGVPFSRTDAFTWYARVVGVRELQPGDTVGYGGEWRARTGMRIATIPVGWADGFGVEPNARTESFVEAAKAAGRVAMVASHRRRSPRAVIIDGRRCPVVGRISMQQATVVVGAGVREGDVAIVPARRLLVNPQIDRVYR